MKLILHITLASLLLIVAGSCSSDKKETTEKPVARALDVNLYPSDLQNIVPADMSKKDSAELIKRFIEKWIQDVLVMKYAESNLTTDQLNIDKEVAE
ncbi:MAG TPA: hypothetical protein VGF30_01705, partial [Bacteroidia bacterium]